MTTENYPETTVWRCDSCGGDVTAQDGYVIWNSSGPARDFRIIHQSRCDDKNLHSSTALKDLIGRTGIAHLLSFLTEGPARRGAHEFSRDIPTDLSDFVDLFRRLHVPNYERARPHFADRRVRERLNGWNERAPYFPSELAWIAELGESPDSD